MDLTDTLQASIGDLAEELKKVGIKDIQLPAFFIPNWPKGVFLKGYLGKRDYCVPVLGSDNLMGWHTGRHGISFWIERDGEIGFEFHGLFGRPVFDEMIGPEVTHKVRWVRSDYPRTLSRIATLVLFDAFKGDVFAKVLAELKSAAPVHNRVADAVMKAFEPFIPSLVADRLSE